jgi:type IV pilus assembly protein PilM
VLFKRSKGLVGLDIGSSSLKMVELRPYPKSKSGFKLQNIGYVPLPSEAIVDGTVIDGEYVIQGIQQLFSENKISTNDVAIAVTGNSVIIKKLKMNLIGDEDDLFANIEMEAQSQIPYDISEVYLDFQVLNQEEVTEGMMDVLLVAAKKDRVEDFKAVVVQAGKNPAVVDVDSFCVQNAFTENYEIFPDQVTALVNIGAAVTNINILQGGQSLFWRDLPTGGNQVSEAIQKEFHVTFEVAEVLKRGEAAEGYDFNQVAPTVKRVLDEILQEIKKTFDFFRNTHGVDRIDKVLVSGGTTKTLNFEKVFGTRFEIPVEKLDPFKGVFIHERNFNLESLNDLKPTCAVAVGLAMRKLGDRS